MYVACNGVSAQEMLIVILWFVVVSLNRNHFVNFNGILISSPIANITQVNEQFHRILLIYLEKLSSPLK